MHDAQREVPRGREATATESTCGCRGLAAGAAVTATGDAASFWGDEDVLELDTVDDHATLSVEKIPEGRAL